MGSLPPNDVVLPIHGAIGCGKKRKTLSQCGGALTPVRIPNQRPFGASVMAVTPIGYDKRDNEMKPGAVNDIVPALHGVMGCGISQCGGAISSCAGSQQKALPLCPQSHLSAYDKGDNDRTGGVFRSSGIYLMVEKNLIGEPS